MQRSQTSYYRGWSHELDLSMRSNGQHNSDYAWQKADYEHSSGSIVANIYIVL